MKTKLLFISIFIFSFLISKSQITITRSDLPCPVANCGLDSVLFTSVPPGVNSVDVNLTGANSIWNVIPLKNGTTAFQKFYPVNMTPIDFQLAFFGSDYAQPLLGNQTLAGLPVTDAYEFYNYAGNDSRLEIKGFAAHMSLQGIPFPLLGVYNGADVLYRFPLNFGDTDSSNSSYSVSVPPTTPFATIKRKQKRVNLVDGWGSMTTPAGTFDVLRVRSEITRVDSVVTQLMPIGVPSNIIEYKWLGVTKKVPVLQVTGNVVANNYTPTTITFWGEDPLSVYTAQSDKNQILVYPNPVIDDVKIQFFLAQTSKVDMIIYDVLGKQVGHFHFINLSMGNHQEVLPTGQLPNGTYFIHYKMNDTHNTYSKFVIQK